MVFGGTCYGLIGIVYRAHCGDLSSMRKLGMFEDGNLEQKEKVFQIDLISTIMGKLLSELLISR
jgi:hypothetical protein